MSREDDRVFRCDLVERFATWKRSFEASGVPSSPSNPVAGRCLCDLFGNEAKDCLKIGRLLQIELMVRQRERSKVGVAFHQSRDDQCVSGDFDLNLIGGRGREVGGATDGFDVSI